MLCYAVFLLNGGQKPRLRQIGNRGISYCVIPCWSWHDHKMSWTKCVAAPRPCAETWRTCQCSSRPDHW